MSTIANLMLIEVVYAYRFIQSINQSGTLPTPPKKVKKGKVEMGLTNPPTPISIKFTHFPVFSFCKWDMGYRGYLAGEKGLKLLLLLRYAFKR